MKPEISEFSYGFALTYELIDALNVTHIGAPKFPTLQQEGAPGGGYDVKIPGHPLFIQFKLSDCLTRKNALDYAYFGGAYYRFKIWAKSNSNQHELLLALEKKHGLVYYVAPKFHTAKVFDQKFVSGQVIDGSAFLHPSTIGPIIDNKEHSISFREGSLTGIFRSKSREIEIMEFRLDVDRYLNVFSLMKFDDDLPTYGSFITQMENTFQSVASVSDRILGDRFRGRPSDMTAAEFARFTALALFGTELFYVEQR